MAAPRVDLSFSRYVAARKGEASARLREGAAYAYGGDLKVRATLDKIRPVTLAVEATMRFWQAVERSRMLGSAIKVTERQFPRLFALARLCAERLQIPPPALYVSAQVTDGPAHTFGTEDEAYVILSASVVDRHTEDELIDVIGRECGHLHNNHTVYLTTYYFLSRASNLFLRWIVKPAVIALSGWVRRAEVTCDRAGLLCTRDLDTSIAAMVKLGLGSQKLFSSIDLDEYLRQLEEHANDPGRFDELLRTRPYLPKRVQALRAFAETTYYRSVIGQSGGISKEACDERVSRILAVLR